MDNRWGRRYLMTGFLLGCGILSLNAYGYIDPGTGSYVLQVAIAFLVGLAFSLRMFRKKIAIFLKRVFSRKRGNGADAS